MKEALHSQIETWNRLIREGRGAEVAAGLRALNYKSLSPEGLARVLNLSWRSGLPMLGLRMGFRHMKRMHALREPPLAAFASEYAACLTAVGARHEARRLLLEVRDKDPRARFYLALLCMKEWDYEGAHGLLESYQKNVESDYQHAVADLNLAASELFLEKYAVARLRLEGLKELTAVRGWSLLHGHALELEAQLWFFARQHETSLSLLQKSANWLSESNNVGLAYTRKWILLNQLFLHGRDDRFFERLDEIKKEARVRQSWETLRELDLYASLAAGNNEIFNKVYFGSPFAHYRKRMLNLAVAFGKSDILKPSPEFKWGVPRDGGKKISLREMVYPSFEASQSFLPRKLLLILVSDFYAPKRVAESFSLLYPGSIFAPNSSPARLTQNLRALERILDEQGSLISIEASEDGHQASPTIGVQLEIHRDDLDDYLLDKEELILRHFNRSLDATTDFSSRDLMSRTGCSLRSANRLLQELEEQGKVIRLGAGKATRYRLRAA